MIIIHRRKKKCFKKDKQIRKEKNNYVNIQLAAVYVNAEYTIIIILNTPL